MKNLKIKGLDELYSCLKSEAGQLKDHSWSSPRFEVIFMSEKNGHHQTSLLGWFFDNIASIKSGCNNLLVAKTVITDPEYGYTKSGEKLFLSSEITSLGLGIRITRSQIKRWGSDGYDGSYGSKMIDPVEQVFVLDIKPVEELV